jgi:Flp pilus assembly protein TadG
VTAHEVEGSIRRFAKREDGQVLPLFAILAYALVQVVFGTYNVGEVVEQKIRLQNAMDAGAYSEAVWEARTYNLMAYINRANVANTQTVFWITTNKSVYDCLSSSNFSTATTMAETFVNTFLGAISATVIGAVIAEPFRAYWTAGFTIG